MVRSKAGVAGVGYQHVGLAPISTLPHLPRPRKQHSPTPIKINKLPIPPTKEISAIGQVGISGIQVIPNTLDSVVTGGTHSACMCHGCGFCLSAHAPVLLRLVFFCLSSCHCIMLLRTAYFSPAVRTRRYLIDSPFKGSHALNMKSSGIQAWCVLYPHRDIRRSIDYAYLKFRRACRADVFLLGESWLLKCSVRQF